MQKSNYCKYVYQRILKIFIYAMSAIHLNLILAYHSGKMIIKINKIAIYQDKKNYKELKISQ